MDTEAYEKRRAAVRDRFIIIATEARLRRQDVNRSSPDLNKLQASQDANERLAAYATEMLAVQGHRLKDDFNKTLSPRLVKRFEVVIPSTVDRNPFDGIVPIGRRGALRRTVWLTVQAAQRAPCRTSSKCGQMASYQLRLVV